MLEEIPDTQQVWGGDGHPFLGRPSSVDLEALGEVLDTFDRYHPMTVESLGRVAVPAPSEA